MSYEVRRFLINISIGFAIFLATALFLVFFPKYRLYSQDFKGQANLRQQEWEKKILIEQAKAEKESATLYAEAEVERAKGVAAANEIIADSLKGNEAYLRYLWIDQVADGENLIYVPTEANLPILEATRVGSEK